MAPRATLPLVFGTFIMNTIAPSLNLAGTTLVVDDARRRGISPGKATSAALLMQITIDGAFCTIMILAFLILLVTVGLSPVWFLLGMVVMLLVGCMIGVLVLGRKRPALMLKILRPIERLVNRVRGVFKKPPLKPWVENIASTFSEAAGLIGHSPKPTLKAYGCSLIASTCELSCFALVGVSFGVTSPEALICGYVVATLFAMISITPQGVGVVEAAVVVAFTMFGETAAAGTAIGLVYRGIVFWMPFLIGAILIQRTKTFQGEGKKAMEGTEKNHLEGADKMAKEIDAMVQAGTGAIPPVPEREHSRNRRNGADKPSPRGGDSQRIVGQLIKESKESLSVDFNKLLGITFPGGERATFVRAELPITDAIRQPYGFVHGGATLTLLEAAASLGAEFHTDLSRELSFRVNVNVTHRKSGVDGTLHGEAAFDREETSSKGYRKLFWNVCARDDGGDVISEGVILCVVVPQRVTIDNPHLSTAPALSR